MLRWGGGLRQEPAQIVPGEMSTPPPPMKGTFTNCISMPVVLLDDIENYIEEHLAAEATNRDSVVNRSATSTSTIA